MGIPLYSTVAGNNNSAPPNGAPESMLPGSVNDCIRQVMADIRTQHESAQWIDYGHTPTKTSSNAFTVAGDKTAIYDVGRRLKFTGSASGYDTISASSYSAPNTTITLTTSPISGTLTAVAVGIISGTNGAFVHTISGSFTGTITGCSSSPTGTILYSKTGHLVTLTLVSAFSGTTNSTAMTLTGIPTSIMPSDVAAYPFKSPAGKFTDNGQTVNGWAASLTTSSITFSLGFDAATAFANGGLSKGLANGWTTTYAVLG